MGHELKPQLVIEPVLNASYDRRKMEIKFRELVTALNKANTNVEYDLSISDDNIYSLTMSCRTTTKEDNIMTYNTADDLHTLLDGLTGGEHGKATWKFDRHVITAEGPVDVDGKDLRCDLHIRWGNGGINDRLTSLEVTNDEEVITATRDDEKALHSLLDSLDEGEAITAELGDSRGSTIMTGKVRTDGAFLEVCGFDACVLRRHSGVLPSFLRSVTVRRTVVQRWEREGSE